jgi:hypothetical protein
MSYIGSTPYAVYRAQPTVVGFNGDNTTVNFTLPYAVSYPEMLEITVNNVQQSPLGNVYSVNALTLTFSEAPSAGSNNIVVIYRT